MDAAIGSEWQGLDQLGEEARAEVIGEAVAVVTGAAMFFTGELKTTLTGERSGRLYRVVGGASITPAMIGPRLPGRAAPGGPLHVASAPGEAPAVLFGHLRNSIGHTEARVVDGHTVEAEVGVGLGVAADNSIAENYAQRLEYGGVDSRGRRFLARPYLGPTRDRVAPIIEDMFDNATGSRP